MNVLKDVEPDQYYYPESDFHITVMSLISCYDGFHYDRIDLSRYAEVVKESIADVGTMGFIFKGITASPSCIMVQGFPTGTGLNILRDRLRKNFRNTDLQQSLDKRYKLQTAHSTVVRFREPLANKKRFLKVLEAYRDYRFGTFRADSLEMVFNDWYQKTELVEKLHTFSL
ncbi:2'-5' RNA ligase family protein [Marinilabilia salmonicolor]|uniref:2'-5' RNA ligase family protein n=1 Tax=Marinilabilia salmonicolor TaxID=989 RepID=UPI0018FFB90F|nr:mutarotase [Marinilabilia salmonicolor]